jgi:ATP-dependent exoDNAse (exonuclease V) beta subunit
VAWAAALRGPWGLQSLAALARVAQIPGDLWFEKLLRFAAPTQPDDCTAALAGLAESLQQARNQVGRRPLSDILTGFLEATGGWAGIAAWEGPRGVANVRTYLDLLAAADDGLPEATFAKADFNLQAAFQPPDPQAQASPVEILTVHGAKGLEFHQVFLPFLDWQPLKSEDNTPPFLLEEIPGRNLHGLALARPYVQEKPSSLYLLLRDLKNQRVVDEARRVFYVAVTRARQRLVMSGVARQDKKGNWQGSGDSPLAWLRQHYAQDLPPAGIPVSWPEPEMHTELITEVQSLASATAPSRELPAAWDFSPEVAPFEISFPSRLSSPPDETVTRPETAAPANGDAARLRGVVMHRALQTVARGNPQPDAVSLAAALRQEGLTAPAATALAAEIETELAACRADPFLTGLLAPDMPWASSEWLLEDQPQPGAIRRGVIDLLVFDGQTWWLLDFKTSRPATGGDWESFISRETGKYRPQLLAYREMAAKAKGIEPPEAIRMGVYFTACRKVVEL